MQLSRAQIDEILDLLNEPENVDAFLKLADENAEARAEWIENEDQPFYTPGNSWVQAHLDWFKALLESRRTQFGYREVPATTIVHFLEPTDFYYYSGENAPADSAYRTHWLRQQELPISAFLLWQTVFSFSHANRQWTARPFLGAARREGERDPLIMLPYSRKYDVERAQAALRRQEWLWERLCRAKDLVGVLEGRVNAVTIGRYPEAKWSWPETEDVQKQLEADDLCFDVCGLMLWGGTIELEILELETVYHFNEEPPKSPSKRVKGPAYARGRYSGPLSERHPSAASYKMMIATALENLSEALWDLLYPYSDEEYEQLQDELERLREQLAPAPELEAGPAQLGH